MVQQYKLPGSPQFTPQTAQTEEQKRKAKVEAAKAALTGLTKAAEQEATTIQGAIPTIEKAYAEQGKAAEMGLQGAAALQLAQQAGLGSGYNKAAARQAAQEAGRQAGLTMGGLATQSAQQVAELQAKAASARTDAASQRLEELKGIEEVETGIEAKEKAETKDYKALEEEAFTSTKDTFDDDEERAVQNLISLFEENREYYLQNPEAAKRLATTMAGIRKNAGMGWEGADVRNFIIQQLGLEGNVYDTAPELDY